MKKKRIWELDFLRGFAILMMVFDHLMYDLGHLDNYFSNFIALDLGFFNWLNNLAESYWISDLRFFGHFFFVSLFLIISGISYTFSKSNLSRSLKLLIVAVLISVVTLAIQYFTGLRMFIIFGVIHMYALSTFLTYVFRKIWNNEVFILVIGMSIIFLGLVIKFWELHYVASITLADIPGIVFGTKAYGADYFGLVPYLGIIMVGTVIGNAFYKNKVTIIPQSKITDKNICIKAGKYSLQIFLLHQLVLFAIIFIVGFIFGYKL
ncbi:MAG: DUF1624 domain-containing protein [Tenericutes bacterium]|nr:DUF1624 domain-containing protein [Mycoplasmatota bacterium]